jgi:hypothetical protein
MKVYIGWDPRDELAFRANVVSMRAHSSIPLDIYPLREYELRRHGLFGRPYKVLSTGQMIDDCDGRPFSTQFTFTRFTIPLLDKSDDVVIFCDADFLWRNDIAKLFDLWDDSKRLMCVQHQHAPEESVKFDGMLQAKYRRKNWSSLMMFKPSRCKIAPALLNCAPGRFLHQFKWLPDDAIGSLSHEWNWLEGSSPADMRPSAVHYTRGTPDMLGALPYDSEWWQAVARWKPDMNHHGVESLCA